MGDIGILQVVSNDVLELIFEELRRCDSWAHYCDMRLLCKTVNELLEPHAFSSVTIGFTEQNMDTILDLLRMLASTTTPHARWTRHLRVHNLVPLAEDGWTVWDRLKTGPNRERLLACQNEWLIPAIKSLPRVEEVEFSASSREPYHSALSSLAELPQLRILKVWFNHPFQPSSDVPLSRFSNLESVELHDVVLSMPILDGVKQLITNSPSLQKFVISRYRWSVGGSVPTLSFVTFDTLIEALLRAPDFTPTLKRLDIDVGGFHLNGSCFPFLACLTHLDIRGLSRKGMPPTFWRGLKHSGIHLQRLAVQPLDTSIIDYLLSYDGLREISLNYTQSIDIPDGPNADTIVSQFFHSVVPHHRDTLQEICFGCGGREPWNASAMFPWIVNEAYLEALSLCKSLEHLDVVYFYPSPNEKVRYPTVPLDILLATASESLPRLQKFGLMHVRDFHKYQSSAYGHEAFYNKVAKAFITHARRSMDKCRQRLRFSLSAIGPSCTTTGRFTRYHIPVKKDCLEQGGDEEDVSDSDADSVISSDFEGCTGIYLCD